MKIQQELLTNPMTVEVANAFAVDGKYEPVDLAVMTIDQFYNLQEGTDVVYILPNKENVKSGCLRKVVARDLDNNKVIFKSGVSISINKCILLQEFMPDTHCVLYSIPKNIQHFNRDLVDLGVDFIFGKYVHGLIPVAVWKYVVSEATLRQKNDMSIKQLESFCFTIDKVEARKGQSVYSCTAFVTNVHGEHFEVPLEGL